MAEEFYYAPLAKHEPARLDQIIGLLSTFGFDPKIKMDSDDACWIFFDDLKSQFEVSITSKEKKEIGLVTLEFCEVDGDDIFEDFDDMLLFLGLSNDPEEKYR